MGTQTCTGSRRIRLDGFSLVKQALVINLLEKIPEGLYISVVICDIWIIHINPISHALSHVHPLGGIFHNLLAACVVIFLYAYLCSDIFLGDTEHLLNSKLYRKTMCIPSGTTVHLISALSLVSADRILDRSCHDMMDTRHAVGRRWTLKEYEFRSSLPQFKGFFKCMILLPPVKHLISHSHEVKTFVLSKLHI